MNATSARSCAEAVAASRNRSQALGGREHCAECRRRIGARTSSPLPWLRRWPASRRPDAGRARRDRSQPPKYFNSRRRESRAFTRALTETTSLELRKSPVRRAEQIDDGRPIRLRDDKGEENIERGGEGLGGERQRVECLIRLPRVAKDRSGQVEVRQRALKDDGDALASPDVRARSRRAPLHDRGR